MHCTSCNVYLEEDEVTHLTLEVLDGKKQVLACDIPLCLSCLAMRVDALEEA